MSYDLAIWEGERPANDAAAGAEYELLFERYLESDDLVEPTARIAAYVTALADRCPDIDSPEPSGPPVYLTMSWNRCAEVSAAASGLAGEHGLVCYDPQAEQLRTPWGQPWRFELTTAHGCSYRDPEPDLVRRVVSRLSNDDYFAVLSRDDDVYIQVGYGEQAEVRPGWFALEYRDGGHYRTEVTDVEEVVRAFVGFLQDDPNVRQRFAWQPR